jgi:hypothetical protein
VPDEYTGTRGETSDLGEGPGTSLLITDVQVVNRATSCPQELTDRVNAFDLIASEILLGVPPPPAPTAVGFGGSRNT